MVEGPLSKVPCLFLEGSIGLCEGRALLHAKEAYGGRVLVQRCPSKTGAFKSALYFGRAPLHKIQKCPSKIQGTFESCAEVPFQNTMHFCKPFSQKRRKVEGLLCKGALRVLTSHATHVNETRGTCH